MSDRLTYHHDAGHGWLAVPLSVFPDALSFSTGFGFFDRSKRVAYLEEDCEAGAFVEAHPEVSWLDVYDGNNSRIRSLPRLSAPRNRRVSDHVGSCV